jgi:hypothetical protein
MAANDSDAANRPPMPLLNAPIRLMDRLFAELRRRDRRLPTRRLGVDDQRLMRSSSSSISSAVVIVFADAE